MIQFFLFNPFFHFLSQGPYLMSITSNNPFSDVIPLNLFWNNIQIPYCGLRNTSHFSTTMHFQRQCF